MDFVDLLKCNISRRFSTGSIDESFDLSRLIFHRQFSFDRLHSKNNNNDNNKTNNNENSAGAGTSGNASRFTYGRQSSLVPEINRRVLREVELKVPGNLNSTMHLLFLSCHGDVDGVKALLDDGIDVNNIDLDGRTALHIAACEENVEVVRLLFSRGANINARDRWGIKHDPKEVPEYELNPGELHFPRDGFIKLARWNGTIVVVKIQHKKGHSDLNIMYGNGFRHELTMLERMRHPNVVQFVGAVIQNQPMMIVSEYHPKGDLRSYLQKKGRLQPYKALIYALNIARGMNYLHECKPYPIIHCDLNPTNVLLDIAGQCKISGFGLIKMSRISSDKEKLANYASDIDTSSLYIAPEVYRNEVFDRSADAFSFGLILYEIIARAPAFHPKAPEDVAMMISLQGLRPSFKTKIKSCPLDLKEID
ncbi:Protein kinase family protein [Zostera marina]|uniref:Protein kinase family protein n=1 Tax=Zostera marina TaxID=29655 RepID=A0A0K9NR99_ZOSMR|nr:Protein kinase family protein [Zostera marina]